MWSGAYVDHNEPASPHRSMGCPRELPGGLHCIVTGNTGLVGLHVGVVDACRVELCHEHHTWLMECCCLGSGPPSGLVMTD